MQSRLAPMAQARTHCSFILPNMAVLWHNQATMFLMRRAERWCSNDQGTSPRLVSRN